MKITGTHICKNCNRNIEWEHVVPQHWGSPQVEQIDIQKAHPINVTKIDENEYSLQIRCKKCDTLNDFTYYTERRL